VTTSRSRRYKCPKHGVWLVLEVHELTPFGRAMTNIQRVEFYRCPKLTLVSIDHPSKRRFRKVRCNFIKPNKWQRRP